MLWATDKEGESVGEYFVTITQAWHKESITVAMMMEGHTIRLPFNESTNDHHIFKVELAGVTFTAEIDIYDATRFPDRVTRTS
jgi:hypothetical protein